MSNIYKPLESDKSIVIPNCNSPKNNVINK